MTSRVAMLYYLKCPIFNKNYKTCKDTKKYGPYIYAGEKTKINKR